MVNFKSVSDNYPKLITTLFCVAVVFMLGLLIKLLELDKTIESFENKTLDWRFQKTYDPNKIDQNIVLVVYDNVSKQKAQSNHDVKLTTFLQPDATVASVIDFLSDAGAKYIIFNAKFEDSNYESTIDSTFLKAIKKAGNVYFPIVFSNSDYSLYQEIDKFAQQHNKIITNPEIEREIIDTWKTNLYKINGTKLPLLLEKFKIDILDDDLFTTFVYKNYNTFNSFNPVYKEVLESCQGVGATNIALSDDGVLRTVYPYVYYKDKFYPSLALAVAKDYMENKKESLEFLSDGNLKLGSRVFPVSDMGGLIVKWMGPTGTYKHYRIYDILNTISNAGSKSKNLKVTPEMFKDKIVIIGETHSKSNILTTPLAKSISGVEVQANIIDNFINTKKFIYKINPIVDILMTIVFSGMTLFALVRLKSGFTVALVYLLLVALYILSSLVLFDLFGIWIYLIYPITVITIIFIIAFLVRYSILSKIYEDTYQTAIKDGLTNLYNHKYFHEVLHDVVLNSRGYQDKFALLMVDVDYFKNFNDTFGHRAGDKALRQVAQTIKRSVRATDFVARYGGEEIAIILFRINYEDSVHFAEKLVDEIQRMPLFLDNNVQTKITVSVGVAHYPRHGKTPSEIVESADRGLYVAKNNGRNQVGIIEPLNDPKS